MNENHDEKGQFASGGGATYSGKSGNLQGRLAQQKANLAKAASKPAGKAGKGAKGTAKGVNTRSAHIAMDKNAATAHDHVQVGVHTGALQSAGTDRASFDKAFANLKGVKKAELSQVARNYSGTVTNFKTMKAAKEDIEKAFIRSARFENKNR